MRATLTQFAHGQHHRRFVWQWASDSGRQFGAVRFDQSGLRLQRLGEGRALRIHDADRRHPAGQMNTAKSTSPAGSPAQWSRT